MGRDEDRAGRGEGLEEEGRDGERAVGRTMGSRLGCEYMYLGEDGRVRQGIRGGLNRPKV